MEVDQSFVRDIARDPNGEATACAVIALNGSLDFEVLAEGMEPREQAEFFLREGQSEAQGYLYDSPLPAAELVGKWRKMVATESALTSSASPGGRGEFCIEV